MPTAIYQINFLLLLLSKKESCPILVHFLENWLFSFPNWKSSAMIFEKDNGLSQIKLALAFSPRQPPPRFFVAFWDWPLLGLHSKIFLSYPNRLFQQISIFRKSPLLPGIYVAQNQQTRLSQYYSNALGYRKAVIWPRCYYRVEKQITLYILGSTETFHKVVIPKEIQKFICQKTL